MSNKQKNNYIIYCHTSPDGKKYIGITNNYNRRCYQHKNKSNGCIAFSRAIKKHGWNLFSHEILAIGLTLHSANFFEAFYIEHFNTLSPNGYNLRSGGDNSLHSEETKQKMSSSHTGENNHFYGKKHTKESILKMTDAKIGKKHTTDHKEKIRAANSGEKSYLFGKIGKDNNLSKTYKISRPDGTIEIIKGLCEYCRINGLTATTMSAVANGNRKHHKNFICEYYNEEIEK